MFKMKNNLFFDCDCSIGRVGYPHLYNIPDVEGLLKEGKVNYPALEHS